MGPIELLVVRFPGNQFSGEIAPALAELVESGVIRIVDAAFVSKNADGTLRVLELNELEDDVYAAFDPVVADITGLLSEDDIQQLSAFLDDDSSAGIMLFEHAWAARFADAVRNSHGEVVLAERIPRPVVEEVLAARAEATA